MIIVRHPGTMTIKQDLEAIEALIRKAPHEATKHHEVSIALQALERVQRAATGPLASAFADAYREAQAKGNDTARCELLALVAVSGAIVERYRVLIPSTSRK